MHTMVDLGEKEEVGPLFDYSNFFYVYCNILQIDKMSMSL